MIVVVGASGKVGFETCKKLRSEGHRVRGLTRTAERATELVAIGCEVFATDIDNSLDLSRHLEGAEAVQLICPLDTKADDLIAATERRIDSLARAVMTARPGLVVAISDYGAHLDGPIGIVGLFRSLEKTLAATGLPVTFLRSAEHMQNWNRAIVGAARSGLLPTFHASRSTSFPTVSASDVGRISANLLTGREPPGLPGIRHVEGPCRYSAEQIGQAMELSLCRKITSFAIPRADRMAFLTTAGAGASYAQLLCEMFDCQDDGLIDYEHQMGVLIKGETRMENILNDVLTRSGVLASTL